jgi:retron-type reverse transcriptase
MYVRFVPASGAINEIFSYRNIYNCYLNCRRKKRNTHNALEFEINAEENLVRLEYSLKNHTYHPSHSILFAAKKPKLREIFAADFKDRVVHHILVNELEKIWEPVFIYDSYACRDGKGTHKAVVRLRKFLRSITANGNVKAYFLQLDIKDFFTSINKQILFSLISKKVSNPYILWLTETILFWDCTKSYTPKGPKQLLLNIPHNKSLFGKDNLCGLPIGNLTSQFFANVFLNELDQFVKHDLKAKYYLRYVDDFVLLSRNKEELLQWKQEIKDFLSVKLNLHLHPKRQKLQQVSNGIDFLGYIIRYNYILVRRRVVNNLRAIIKAFAISKIKDFNKFNDSIASYMGHFKWANSYRLRQYILN